MTAQADERRGPALPINTLHMRFDIERLAVLRRDFDRAHDIARRRRPTREMTGKDARQSAVAIELVEIGVAEIIEQRAIGEERIGPARHEHADRQHVDEPGARKRGIERVPARVLQGAGDVLDEITGRPL